MGPQPLVPQQFPGGRSSSANCALVPRLRQPSGCPFCTLELARCRKEPCWDLRPATGGCVPWPRSDPAVITTGLARRLWAPVVTKGIRVGSPLRGGTVRRGGGAEWGMCVKIIPYSVAGKRQRANSRALLIAGCLVGLPCASHMVTHMQRGAGWRCGTGIVPLSCWVAERGRDPSRSSSLEF